MVKYLQYSRAVSKGLPIAVVVAIIGVAFGAYLAGSIYSTYSTTYSMKGTYVNTYFSVSCSITGVGGSEFRIVSDYTGLPVNANNIVAVNGVECSGENQVVYTNEFSRLGGGWYVPILPNQATMGGGFQYHGNIRR